MFQDGSSSGREELIIANLRFMFSLSPSILIFSQFLCTLCLSPRPLPPSLPLLLFLSLSHTTSPTCHRRHRQPGPTTYGGGLKPWLPASRGLGDWLMGVAGVVDGVAGVVDGGGVDGRGNRCWLMGVPGVVDGE